MVIGHLRSPGYHITRSRVQNAVRATDNVRTLDLLSRDFLLCNRT